VDLAKFTGKLIVVEGADVRAVRPRSRALVEWLEGVGHATSKLGEALDFGYAELDKVMQATF